MADAALTAREVQALRPYGGFRCILMDLPWRFETFDGKSAVPTQAEDPYPTMTLEEIAALPVPSLASLDCWLAMWTTWPMLPAALGLIAGWGFSYKTGGAWSKMTVNGKQAFGTGYIFRGASEPLLVASRGSPRWLSKRERNAWHEPVREHSRKPEAVAAMLERSTSGPRLEMFAREPRPGWTAWGNEIHKFAE